MSDYIKFVQLYLHDGGSKSDHSVGGDGGGGGTRKHAAAVDLTEFDVWMRHCVAGGTSAAVIKTLAAPMDRVRIHMQITADDGSFWKTVKYVHGSQGVRGFWRGNILDVFKSSPEFAIKFSVYDFTKRQLIAASNRDGQLHSYERFVAGALAGVCSFAPLYPIEILKTRIVVGKHKNVADAVATMYKNDGILAFFRGFWLSTLNIFLFTGIDLATYEYVKSWLTRRSDSSRDDHNNNNWSVNLISATCSSTLGVTVCYPISTLITRIQADDGFSGLRNAVVKRKPDFRGLYRGYLSSFVKVLPSMSLSYVIYEEVCKELGVRMS